MITEGSGGDGAGWFNDLAVAAAPYLAFGADPVGATRYRAGAAADAAATAAGESAARLGTSLTQPIAEVSSTARTWGYAAIALSVALGIAGVAFIVLQVRKGLA